MKKLKKGASALTFLAVLMVSSGAFAQETPKTEQEKGTRLELGSRSWILDAGGGYGVPYGGAGVSADLRFTDQLAATVGVGFGNGFRAVGGARFYLPFERDERFEPRLAVLGGRVSGREDAFGLAIGGGTLFFLRENIFLNGELYAVSPEAKLGDWDIGFAVGGGVRLDL
ncbi:MAG: hypothetical protein R6V10_08625 [bacterium]